jgi:hypothetical protein
MAVDFKKLLSKNMDESERPRPLAPGTYYGRVTKFICDVSKEKKTPYVRFLLAVTSAGEGVDSESLNGVDLSKKQLRKDFYLTNDADYRLKDFIKSCGIQVAGRSFESTLPDTVNAPVIMEVTQRAATDGSGEFYNDVNIIKGQP